MVSRESFFIERASKRFGKRNSLKGDINADTLVVGAGIAGVATAYQLSKRMKPEEIVVVDSDRVGFSTTGHSSGLVVDCVENNYCNTSPELHKETVRGLYGLLVVLSELHVRASQQAYFPQLLQNIAPVLLRRKLFLLLVFPFLFFLLTFVCFILPA